MKRQETKRRDEEKEVNDGKKDRIAGFSVRAAATVAAVRYVPLSC